jgi:RNA-directed DNA polymerase
VNTGDPWPDLNEAEWRVREMQRKLHQWAISDPDRCFDDLYNLSATRRSSSWRGVG